MGMKQQYLIYLNLSDGILGDCLKTQIVATFNTQ